jgi:hypothetical protein
MSGKKTKQQQKYEAQWHANREANIRGAQSECGPGQHILTCSQCKKLVRVPTSQTMIYCIQRGCNGHGPKIHPGEIPGGQYYLL